MYNEHVHVHRRIRRNSKWRKIEEFVHKQMQKYIKIHKEHEKQLRYIG